MAIIQTLTVPAFFLDDEVLQKFVEQAKLQKAEFESDFGGIDQVMQEFIDQLEKLLATR